MAKKITEIEGIGPATAKKLEAVGITTVESLLKKGSEPKGRAEIAKEAGMSDKDVLKFVNMADLFRVKGIGSQYAELLQAVGINTVVELGKRNAENLHAKMVEMNEQKKLVLKVPPVTTVTQFVESAKEMPRVVNY